MFQSAYIKITTLFLSNLDTMARAVENIKDLNDSKYLWKLAVLVKDLWVVNNQKGVKHVEMVLTDKMVWSSAHLIILMCSVNQHLRTLLCK
jgi:hypothetical protein